MADPRENQKPKFDPPTTSPPAAPTAVTNPDGSVTVTSPNGHVATYAYENGVLVLNDSNGNQVFYTNEYQFENLVLGQSPEVDAQLQALLEGRTLYGGGGGGQAGDVNAVQRMTLQEVLQTFGIDPAPFGSLIDQAIRDGWSGDLLLSRIFQTQDFRNMFPGIENLNQKYGYNWRESVQVYRGLRQRYASVAQDFGYTGLDARTVGMLVTGDVSPDEWSSVLEGHRRAKEDPTWLDRLSAVEGRQVGLKDVVDFLGGLAPAERYDAYEAVALTQLGGLDAQTARQLARSLGVAGQESDLRALPEALSAFNQPAGQELRAAGLSPADLVEAALAGQFEGDRALSAQRKREAVVQVLRNRQARSQARPQQALALRGDRPVTRQTYLESIG